MKRAWLITAFEPFAGRPENNSQAVLNEIKKLVSANASDPTLPFDFHFHILPTEYDGCFTNLMTHVETLASKNKQLKKKPYRIHLKHNTILNYF